MAEYGEQTIPGPDDTTLLKKIFELNDLIKVMEEYFAMVALFLDSKLLGTHNDIKTEEKLRESQNACKVYPDEATGQHLSPDKWTETEKKTAQYGFLWGDIFPALEDWERAQINREGGRIKFHLGEKCDTPRLVFEERSERYQFQAGKDNFPPAERAPGSSGRFPMAVGKRPDK